MNELDRGFGKRDIGQIGHGSDRFDLAAVAGTVEVDGDGRDAGFGERVEQRCLADGAAIGDAPAVLGVRGHALGEHSAEAGFWGFIGHVLLLLVSKKNAGDAPREVW